MTFPAGARVGNAGRTIAYVPASLAGRTAAVVGLPQAVARSQAALIEAEQLDQQGSDVAVDRYYQAAIGAARVLEAGAAPATRETAWNVYHQGLVGLIDAGQAYGRLDPRRQLIVVDGGTRVVPITYVGFAWQPHEFCRLLLAGNYQSRDIATHFKTPGFGISLIAERVSCQSEERYFRQRHPFSATAVLRPLGSTGSGVLEFYNPRTVDHVAWAGSSLPLSRDLTAPLAAIVVENPRQYLRGFTAPNDTSVKPKLFMVEPYQRGKIPVVFIHGLYSDPITWVDTVNELRAESDLDHRYQFWTFRYPTGGAILDSTSAFRAQLVHARNEFDPAHSDPALDQMVLIGHSLGGLVAKMQVTTSYDLLWRQMASQPFAAVRAPPQARTRLARDFFFNPVPSVTRVVFIGTPHHGSTMATRIVGRIGDQLIRFGAESDAEYRQLMGMNPGVFKPSVTGSRPTTIDLLEPSSPLLAGLQQMPVNPAVRMHSLIGTGGIRLLGEPGDGLVAVSSARQAGVQSELIVPVRHEKLHRDPRSVAELARILREHAGSAGLQVVRRSSP
jgi:pimeloyl-ACP methyl ester carboxylesterase